jgi:hypothetical protein
VGAPMAMPAMNRHATNAERFHAPTLLMTKPDKARRPSAHRGYDSYRPGGRRLVHRPTYTVRSRQQHRERRGKGKYFAKRMHDTGDDRCVNPNKIPASLQWDNSELCHYL